MRKQKYLMISIIVVLSLVLVSQVYARPLAATSPDLGAAGSYSVHGGETVTNTGPSTIAGDLGVSPGSAVTGFPPGIVTPPYTIHIADGSAAAAKAAFATAFDDLDQTCDTDWTGTGLVDLVSMDLIPGVYCADAFALTGTLTLSGTADEVWIFKSGTDLVTSGTANVVGPPNACYVWWRVVSSATLGTGTKFIGNILASTSITLATGASLEGRAFAYTGAVTLDNNTIGAAICLAPPAPTSTPTPTTGPGPTSTPRPRRTATPAPVIPGLPKAGSGAPILNTDFLWGLLIGGGISAMVLVGVRAFRRTNRPKQ